MIFHVANNLWRGPRPADITELIKNNFTDVIDLESGTRDFFHDDLFERQLIFQKSFCNHRITCSWLTPPYSTQVDEFLKLVKDSEKVFVHCQAGKDRTGFMCAVYRMQVCGWTYKQAVAEYKAMGLHFYYFWWVKALKRYAING